MKFLRKFLDKLEPQFKKGGKFPYLESTFDAFSSFLFVPNHTTQKGSHIRDAIDLKRTMSMVILALMPALIFGIWNVGHQHYLSQGQVFHSITDMLFDKLIFGIIKVLPLLIVSYVVGLSIEFAFAQIRGHKVNEGFLVTGMLIPLIVPPDIPLWMLALATAFAVIIGKEVFGGTGMNIFNPALLARAFLFFSYPAYMSGDMVWIAEKADAYSGATPLAMVASGETTHLPSFWDMFVGIIPGSVGETSTIAILIGAVFLIFTGIGSVRIMISVFAGGYLTGLLFNLWGANSYMMLPAHYHLVIGGFAFGAVFMATDPVTAAQTNTGKVIYGLLIGAFAVLIRVLNPAYPEGMMLSILLLNTFAPLIDHYVIEAHIKRRLKRSNLVKTTNH
ncbi:MAG: Na(+)-translocating NADH-quinone reductase subunit B [Bacteroidetes bacterium ADurb.Bin408]|nr:MAG: Na(+)-translocating NADH-quinone reductase subunit B [Bacteroidetes bacterium ADurb.Bin408]